MARSQTPTCRYCLPTMREPLPTSMFSQTICAYAPWKAQLNEKNTMEQAPTLETRSQLGSHNDTDQALMTVRTS